LFWERPPIDTEESKWFSQNPDLKPYRFTGNYGDLVTLDGVNETLAMLEYGEGLAKLLHEKIYEL
jgi:hypothetical protein